MCLIKTGIIVIVIFVWMVPKYVLFGHSTTLRTVRCREHRRSLCIFGAKTEDLLKLADKSGKWESITNQRAFMDDLAKKLNITNIEEWYNITGKIMRQYGGFELLRMYNNSTKTLLSSVYPEYLQLLMIFQMLLHTCIYKWDSHKFTKVVVSSWNQLASLDQRLPTDSVSITPG